MILSGISPCLSSPPLFLNKISLENVSNFIHFSILISSDLCCPLHICSVCLKVRKIPGMIFHNFYRHSSPSLLLKLISLILPHLTYCSAIWAPPPKSVHPHSLLSTDKFALRICSHIWQAHYSHFLHLFNLPSLSTHFSISQHSPLYKILNKIT